MTSDKLTIDTPEQVHLEFVLADIGSRFMALLLDTLIQTAAVSVLFIIAIILASSFLESLFTNYALWVGAIAGFAIFSLMWGYYAFFEVYWKGQTPGKRWAGIRVIKESGRPINAFEAISRNLLRVVDGQLAYGVGVVTMLLNSRRRRLGDFVAGTLVVHEAAGRESEIFFNTPESSEFAFHQAARLTVQEAELIETFLARRLDIPPAVRQQNAQRIADMVSSRLGIAAETRPADNENFLEIMVKEFRTRARVR